MGLNMLQSLLLPFAMLPMLHFTTSAGVMGRFAGSVAVRAATNPNPHPDPHPSPNPNPNPNPNSNPEAARTALPGDSSYRPGSVIR